MIWPALPDRIATHFDVAGRPNDWSSRTELAAIIGMPISMFAGLFGADGWLFWRFRRPQGA